MYEAQKKHTIVDTCIIYKLKQHMVDIKKKQQQSIIRVNYYFVCF